VQVRRVLWYNGGKETHMRRIVVAIGREFREILPAMLFFLVAFHMIALTKTALLRDYQVDVSTSALATLGAVLVAKAILVVEKLPVARLFSRRLVYNIFWKAFLFGAVAMLFRLLEELVRALLRHEDAGTVLRQLPGSVSWLHFCVFQMWLFALLLLYCLAAELVRVVGAGKVRAMLLGPRGG